MFFFHLNWFNLMAVNLLDSSCSPCPTPPGVLFLPLGFRKDVSGDFLENVDWVRRIQGNGMKGLIVDIFSLLMGFRDDSPERRNRIHPSIPSGLLNLNILPNHQPRSRLPLPKPQPRLPPHRVPLAILFRL